MIFNNSRNVRLDSNTFYNNYWGLHWANYDGAITMDNISFHHNDIVSMSANQLVLHIELLNSAMPGSFVADSNYYARPIDDSLTIHTGLALNNYNRNLYDWEKFCGRRYTFKEIAKNHIKYWRTKV